MSRYFRAQVREYAVYVRGFGELCRRLFLFASDVTPGGRMTVSAFLVILAAVLCFFKLFTFLRLFLQLLELVYGIFSFLLRPLVLTIKVFLALFDLIFEVVYLLFRAFLYIASGLQVVGNFVWPNLVSIMSELYRCWQIFLKITLIFLEKFIFVVIPFTTKITFAFLGFAFDVSCVAYEKFLTTRIIVEKLDPFNPNSIGVYVLTFWALLLAFRFRKRFLGTFCSEIDGSRPPVTSGTAASGYGTHATTTSSLRGNGFSFQTTTTYDGARSTTRRDEDSSLRHRGKTKEVSEGGNVDDPTEDFEEREQLDELHRWVQDACWNTRKQDDREKEQPSQAGLKLCDYEIGERLGSNSSNSAVYAASHREKNHATKMRFTFGAASQSTSLFQDDREKEQPSQAGLKLCDYEIGERLGSNSSNSAVYAASHREKNHATKMQFNFGAASQSTSRFQKFAKECQMLPSDREWRANKQGTATICSDMLLGKCTKSHLCQRFHYSTPYCWQYRFSDSEQWKNFHSDDNINIEQLFCNALESENVVQVTLRINYFTSSSLLRKQCPHYINFDEMTMKNDTSFEASLQRLSTPSYAQKPNNAMSTKWVWYWQDDDGWKKYGAKKGSTGPKQEDIEAAYIRGDKSISFRLSSFKYQITFCGVLMYQINLDPRYLTVRNVRRRPLFVSRAEMDLQGMRLAASYPYHTPLPSDWTALPPNKEFVRVPLSHDSAEFQSVKGLFHKTIKKREAMILEVERVQNPLYWEKYERKRTHMRKALNAATNDEIERRLFHGTSETVIDAICNQNFDHRVSGKHGTTYGDGSYFATTAKYSNNYSNNYTGKTRFMFLANVLTGKYILGNNSMRRPPPRDPSDPAGLLYDSCVDREQDPRIFVIFDKEQCYPSYLIKYEFKDLGFQDQP